MNISKVDGISTILSNNEFWGDNGKEGNGITTRLLLCAIKWSSAELLQNVRFWIQIPSGSSRGSGVWITHYNGVIMGAIASQITSIMIVYSIVYSDANQRKHQSSASLAFVRGIHRRPVNSPYKWPVTRKMFPFDDVVMPVKTSLLIDWRTEKPVLKIFVNQHRFNMDISTNTGDVAI